MKVKHKHMMYSTAGLKTAFMESRDFSVHKAFMFQLTLVNFDLKTLGLFSSRQDSSSGICIFLMASVNHTFTKWDLGQ